jgi:hypothetical protein
LGFADGEAEPLHNGSTPGSTALRPRYIFKNWLNPVRRYPVPKMTTRQKVERLLDRLSEEELAAEYQRLRQTVEGERTPDDLAELAQFSARASRGVLRHMTEDEEEAGLSWEEFRPQ